MSARTVFLGSGGFAVPVLEALAGSPDVDIVGVVTTPPRPVGRDAVITPTPVERRAKRFGLPVFAPERLREPMGQVAVEVLEPDLMVLADYGQIVPQALLDLPPHGALNLHPSLLPRHRGAIPVPAAIMAGDEVTGVSLMRMDAGLDTGPVIAQVRVPLTGDEDAPGLEARLAEVAAELLRGSLAGWLSGSLIATPQATDGATLTRPLRREDGRLEPALTAVELGRRVRGLRPWPGTFLDRTEGRLIVHEARVLDDPLPADVRPGDLVAVGAGKGTGLALVTGSGLLGLDVVQVAGKGRMTGAELVRGRRDWLAVPAS